MNYCNICSAQTSFTFSACICSRYRANYFRCHSCGFLAVENPYWIKETYDHPINKSDTGYLERNLTLSRRLGVTLAFMTQNRDKFLDYGGGLGLLVRRMRDLGFDFYWKDPYAKNLFARGFDCSSRPSGKSPYAAITSIETFEHFENPSYEFNNMLQLSRTIFFTTELLPTPLPQPNEWWYYGLEHGQHISFFTLDSLKHLASMHDMHLTSRNSLHLITDRRDLAIQLFPLLDAFSLILFPFLRIFRRSLTQTDHESFRVE